LVGDGDVVPEGEGEGEASGEGEGDADGDFDGLADLDGLAECDTDGDGSAVTGGTYAGATEAGDGVKVGTGLAEADVGGVRGAVAVTTGAAGLLTDALTLGRISRGRAA